ncbi:unnamed protein product [Mytilus edulis]|uniref:TIR domain-containing protein n=1 Tax=Mytilus edulis TaxID=6550 RepID=A0A8S3QSX3_MYTED|nr:unnamed protein product [Mytilus edulis]
MGCNTSTLSSEWNSEEDASHLDENSSPQSVTSVIQTLILLIEGHFKRSKNNGLTMDFWETAILLCYHFQSILQYQPLTKKLQQWKIPHLKDIEMESEEESGILGSLCGILHNITMFEDNVPKVRAVKCIKAVKPYLESKDNTIRLLCLATLADLVNESESEMIKSNDEIIQFLMLTISMAIDTDNRASWSLVELSRKTYIDQGIIPKGLILKASPLTTGEKSNRFFHRWNNILYNSSFSLMDLLRQEAIHQVNYLYKLRDNLHCRSREQLSDPELDEIQDKEVDNEEDSDTSAKEEEIIIPHFQKRSSWFQNLVNLLHWKMLSTKTKSDVVHLTNLSIVRQVARNDNNKRTVVQHGAVPLLMRIYESGNIEEQRELTNSEEKLLSRGLNFCPIPANINNLQLETDVDQFARRLRLKEHFNRQHKKNLQEAGMNDLEYESDKEDKCIPRFKKKSEWNPPRTQNLEKSDDKEDGSRHIMLSYNWGHQPMVKDIRDVLKNSGIKVWMDMDDMQGSTIKAMAKAVKQADIYYSFIGRIRISTEEKDCTFKNGNELQAGCYFEICFACYVSENPKKDKSDVIISVKKWTAEQVDKWLDDNSLPK